MRVRAAVLLLGTALLLLGAGCGGGDQQADRAQQLAALAATEVDAVVREAQERLTALAGDPALALPDPEAGTHDADHDADEEAGELEAERRRSRARCTAAVRRASGNGLLTGIGRAIVDDAGGVDCFSSPLDGRWSVGDRTFFLRAYNSGRFAVGDYQFDGDRVPPSVGVAVPLEGAVVFGLVDVRALGERLRALPLPEGADVVVTDGNGTVVARPTTAYAVGRSQAGLDPLTDAMLERDDGTGEFEYEGRRRRYAFAVPPAARGQLRVAVGVAP
jgi:hypothetical protein